MLNDFCTIFLINKYIQIMVIPLDSLTVLTRSSMDYRNITSFGIAAFLLTLVCVLQALLEHSVWTSARIRRPQRRHSE